LTNKINNLTLKEILLKGTIIAVIISVPSLVSFMAAWVILDNLLIAALIGVVIHFIAMGFALKISKKLLVKRNL
jgi:hypothetical protein